MEIVHEQAFSLDFWHLYISLSQNPEEQRQNWNTFIWVFQNFQWGYFQKLGKGHGDSFFFPLILLLWKSFIIQIHYGKKIAISKCVLFAECLNKNFLVQFQVQKTILLNTVAIQVQFKDPMAIFKRSKD